MGHADRTVQPPSAAQIREASRAHGLDLSPAEVEMLGEFLGDTVESYDRVDSLPDPLPEEPPDRASHRPDGEEDPLNAFVSVTDVGGADSGPLEGYAVGLKDNVALAGVPMTCGWRPLEGCVPSADATVVERLLDAGATVAGKLNMEALAFGGSGELSDFGPVRNPHDHAYLAGGSSGGCAAAVAAGDVDVAVGTDAGGSIRRPAAWCGCVGLKPTFGLVPYTGVVSQAYSVDHVGPMARTVRDCARTLDVIAGGDGLDPRQRGVETGQYTAAATAASAADVSVAVVEEGFGQNPAARDVDEAVREALATFEAAGGAVSTRRVARHDDGPAIWTALNLAEMVAQERRGGGHPTTGFVDPDLAAAYSRARRQNAAAFPPTLKLALVAGEYVSATYGGRFHRKARRLRRGLADAYDAALADADVLAMPTVPELPSAVRRNLSDAELVERALGLLTNRAPFNATGHPVVSVPAGTVDGFPVGVSFVGRRGDDETVLRAASAFEETLPT